MIFIGGNVRDFACGKTHRLFRGQMLTAAINNKKNIIAIGMSMMLMNATGLKRAGAEQDIFGTYRLPGDQPEDTKTDKAGFLVKTGISLEVPAEPPRAPFFIRLAFE